jgi:uncharacterized protein
MPGRAARHEPTAAARHVCVVLHDVAPARWDACTRVLKQVAVAARRAGTTVPVTLLVVPQFHGDPALPLPYLRWLHRQARAGHELALHGLTHRDDGPPPRGLAERLLRRVHTDGEGEFAALPLAEAQDRLARARAWARSHGLSMPGFVAPAWLLNEAGWTAVSAAGFDYTCTLDRIVALPDRAALWAPSLVFSTRARWRRLLSVAWVALLGRVARRAPLLRFELHPDDADHPAVLRCWMQQLQHALRVRRPLPLREAARLARQSGMPPARRAA